MKIPVVINIDRNAIENLLDVVIVSVFIQALVNSYGYNEATNNSVLDLMWAVLIMLIVASSIRRLWSKLWN